MRADVAGKERALKLLQGYIWHPKELDVDLGDYLPTTLEGGVHVLWDRMPRPPFSFFDDGTLAASQHVYQFTVLKLLTDEDDEPGGLIPWLAEILQEKLESTPEGVGWQIFEDLREIG